MPDDLLKGDETDEQTAAEAVDPPEDDEADPAAGEGDAEDPPEDAAEAEAGDSEGGEADELVITLGDEEPEQIDPANETPPIRQMRQAMRDKDRELRRLAQENAQLKAVQQPAQPSATDPGEKPKLADFDFDEDKFGEALEAWHEKNVAHKRAQAEREEAAKKQQEAWAQRLDGYKTAAKSLKVPDFEDAEVTVIGTLNAVQQSLLLKAKKPEILVYALGKSPKRLQELAKIADPVDFVFAVADVQREIKVQQQSKRPPAPEKTVRGGGVGAGAAMIATAGLEKLKEKARETGDYSEYFAAKAKLEGKKAA